MIVKACEITGKNDGWLKKITAETVDLKKNNGYSLIGEFYNYNESCVVKKDEFFVIDTGIRGSRILYNCKKKQIKKEERRKIQKKAGFSEEILAKIENSLLYDYAAYVIAIAKLKQPVKSINPLEKFTVDQLVKELQNRGYDVKVNEEVFLKTTKAEKNGRFAALEME